MTDTNWQARFSAVAQCVYTVIWDADEQMTAIIDGLLAKGTIDGFTAKHWPHARRDAEAYVLEEKKNAAVDSLQNLIVRDIHAHSNIKAPAHGRDTMPAMFAELDGLIQGMQVVVPAVESRYGVDCTELKDTITVARRELHAYLDAEDRGKAT